MRKVRQAQTSAELSQEQEELAQRIHQRLLSKMDEELLAMARRMAPEADHEIFGNGGNDRLAHTRGAGHQRALNQRPCEARSMSLRFHQAGRPFPRAGNHTPWWSGF